MLSLSGENETHTLRPIAITTDLRGMKAFWDARYAEEAYAYGTEPNGWFAQQLATLPPGTMLLPAEGEGRNAVHAARMGWQVTAFDISAQGREKAMRLAARHGVHITYHVGALHEIGPLATGFDAIGFSFAHFPSAVRASLTTAIMQHLRPGGAVVFEAFAKEQLKYQPVHGSGGPQEAAMLYTIEEANAEFAGVDFHVLEEVEVQLNEGSYHQGLAKVVRGSGVKR